VIQDRVFFRRDSACSGSGREVDRSFPALQRPKLNNPKNRTPGMTQKIHIFSRVVGPVIPRRESVGDPGPASAGRSDCADNAGSTASLAAAITSRPAFLEVDSATSRLSRWPHRWQSDRLFPMLAGKITMPRWESAAGDEAA